MHTYSDIYLNYEMETEMIMQISVIRYIGSTICLCTIVCSLKTKIWVTPQLKKIDLRITSRYCLAGYRLIKHPLCQQIAGIVKQHWIQWID